MSAQVKKFGFSNSPEISEPDNHLILKQIISDRDFSGAVSMTWVKINGQHKSLRTHSKLRVYLILSGSLEFKIDDEQILQLEKFDVLTLEAGTSYSLNGTGEYVVLNAPAFKDGDDEYL